MVILSLVSLMLAALCALSIRSLIVLGRRSPATSAGWTFTLLYGIFAVIHEGGPGLMPPVLEDAPLVFLTVAFVIAGRRDEAQAEPWWWPRTIGPTGAERAKRNR